MVVGNVIRSSVPRCVSCVVGTRAGLSCIWPPLERSVKLKEKIRKLPSKVILKLLNLVVDFSQNIFFSNLDREFA